MKTHYDPFYSSHDPYGENNSEKGYCGTLLSENNSTNDKTFVDCKKCINKFEQADKEMEEHRENEALYYRGWAEHLESLNSQP